MSEEKKSGAPAAEPGRADPMPEEDLANKLAEQANAVTSGLRDLLPNSKPTGYEEARPVKGTAEAAALPGSDEVKDAATLPEDTPVEVAAPSPAVVPAQPDAGTVGAAASDRAVEAPAAAIESSSDDRLMSTLAWLTMVLLQLPIVSVIQLFATTTRDRPFQRHHAITSLLFYVAAIVYEVAAGIIYAILGALTLGCGYACLWVIFFLPHALGLYYALQAYNGKTIELPVLSKLGRDQGWL
jgi:uncharacterized membrane protein